MTAEEIYRWNWRMFMSVALVAWKAGDAATCGSMWREALEMYDCNERHHQRCKMKGAM